MTAPAALGRPPRRVPGVPGPGPVLVVIGTYPLLTTTFIDREIHGLRRLGVDLRLCAIRRPGDDVPLSSDQRALAREVTYLLPARVPFLVAALASELGRRPLRALGTLAYLLTRPHPGARSRFRTLLHFGLGICVARVARAEGVREIYAHFVDRAATVALTASRLLGVPYHLSVHAGADVFVEPVLVREKLAAATHVTTCTRRNKERLAELAGADVAAKVRVVPHGIDLEALPVVLPAPEPDPVVLAVGQLTERKGLHVLVRACARLRRSGHRFRCRVVGAGPQREALERLARELAVDDLVTFTGALPHEEVVAEYARAGVFVMPCVTASDGDVDGIPNVLLEAMAMRVPVVASDQPAIRELVTDGENGLLVPAGDDDALAGAVATLLDEVRLRHRLAAAGRDAVRRRFDLATNVRGVAAALWPAAFAAPGEGAR
ncbi:MAG: colanic acid biosynthesis glycosyltransferase WcaL [Acidimicrobiia bacterium]|nr:MAG: colanic acid biosynthesis glycosyltransferase WcaL [Acidimicrobiia bacterium]